MIHKLRFYFIYNALLALLPGYGQVRLNMAVAQSYVNDWQMGEMHTIEMTTGSDMRFRFKLDTFDCTFNFRHGAGVAYHKPLDSFPPYIRPTDNEIFFESIVKYPLGWKLDPYISGSLQTQITESFRYNKNIRIATSSFRDPITTMQSLGLAYGIGKGKEFFNSRLGITLKQIRADKFTQLTDDLKTPMLKERYRSDTGIQWKTEASAMIDSSASYMGALEFFISFGAIENWSLKFQNEFQFFIWRFLGY